MTEHEAEREKGCEADPRLGSCLFAGYSPNAVRYYTQRPLLLEVGQDTLQRSHLYIGYNHAFARRVAR
jgi:hypothetical protein